MSFFKNKKFYVIMTLIVAGTTYYYFSRNNSDQVTYEYIQPTIKTFQTTVEWSGNVSTSKEVELKALTSWQIVKVNVKPGAKVKAWQIIAQIDGRSAAAQIAQQKASYQKIVNGNTNQDIAITNSQVQAAKVTLENAQKNLEAVKKENDVAIKNASRTLYSTNIEATPVDNATVSSNEKRPEVSWIYNCKEDTEYDISISSDNYFSYSSSNQGTITLPLTKWIPQSIGKCGILVTFDINTDYKIGHWKIGIPNKLSSNYSTLYNTYLTAVSNREKALLNAEQTISNAEASLASAIASLDQKQAPTRKEDVALYRASLSSAQISYDNTLIKAPFDWVIWKIDLSVWDFVTTWTTVAIISNDKKVADITLNEIDVAQVKIGQKAVLTFDATPDKTIKWTISEIDSVGTNESNVITFWLKIAFDEDDERIRSAMSVTATIIVFEKEKALLIPASAINTEWDKIYVLIKDTDTKNALSGENMKTINKKIYVTVWLKSDIEVEILSGLVGDEEVLYRTLQKKVEKAGALIGPPAKQ